MEEKLDLILVTLTEMKQDVAVLKDDVAMLKQNVTRLEHNYNYLTSLVHNLAEKLETLTKQVAIMEKEHSEKLQVLLDQQAECVKRHVNIACDLVEIDHTFAKHDARLYALEHVN